MSSLTKEPISEEVGAAMSKHVTPMSESASLQFAIASSVLRSDDCVGQLSAGGTFEAAFFGYCMVIRPEIPGKFPLERTNSFVRVAPACATKGKVCSWLSTSIRSYGFGINTA